nr:puratrophin-1 isoform X3 [Odocoileus virginianus texanus]
MEGPLEDGDESPESQGHATDWRFAVCSFRDAWDEGEPAPQIQAKNPHPPSPPAEAAGEELQGSPLPGELQSPAGQMVADESGHGQKGTLGGSSVHMNEPASYGVEILLSPMSSHLSLAQGENDSQGGDLAGDSVSGRVVPVRLDPEGLDSDPVNHGGRLSETSSGLLEADSHRSRLLKSTDYLLAQDLAWELLASGMAALPGTRDVEGRAVLLLCAHNSAWNHPKCNSHELVHLLLYLQSIPRPKVQTLGLTVLVDARICSPSSSMFWGLSQLQEAVPRSVHRVLLVGKLPEEVPAGLQLEHLSSHQSLLTHISTSELLTSLGGGLPYCHQAWLDFRMRLEALLQSCQGICALLQGAIESMKAVPQPMESGEVGRLLQQARVLMEHVLDSPRLAWLQCQGALELTWLKQEVPEVTLSPDYRSAVDEVEELYGRVDGLLHQLTLQGNRRIQALELVQTLEAQEGELHQMEVWLQQVGWPALEEFREPSLDMLLQAQGPFRELDQIAQEQVRRAEKCLQPLVGCDAAELGPFGTRFLTLQTQLADFSRALAQRRQRLADAEKLLQFFKQGAVTPGAPTDFSWCWRRWWLQRGSMSVPWTTPWRTTSLSWIALMCPRASVASVPNSLATWRSCGTSTATFSCRVQFGMYALYSKNKPRSDALMTSYGHVFFRDKQQALGDHLDLASYLLKPIQRMSKYALLLQELARACGGPAQELSALRAAQSLVHFQLRHGNDLLAMDAIHGCDVNLKEQGQLVRQDEFTVRCGRHKSLRRIFLFEELLLFSKPRRGPTGVDMFTYKRSFKMADLGLTECCGDNNLRFEIWFRRRKAKDTFVLQAASLATKQAWTADISRLLWRQAVHNKEVRMAEMVSMGVGNKAFRDIAPSEEAINDRTVNYILKCQAVRSRASIAVAPFDSDSPYLGASSALPGDPASCSVLGSLNLHLHRDPALLGFRWPLYSTSFPEEAALETDAELGSQPSLTPEDSEVSSQCPSASGSSGSDSSCVSGQILGKGLEDLSYV